MSKRCWQCCALSIALLVLAGCDKTLDTHVDTATKNPYGSQLAKGIYVQADLFNAGIKHAKAKLDKSKAMLTITFDYQPTAWIRFPDQGTGYALWGYPLQFLIRVFDRTGHPVTYFTTKERFIPEEVVKQIVKTKGMTQQWCDPGQCKESSFPNQLKPSGNVLTYQIDARAADYAESVEVGFETDGIIGSKEIWRP